MSDLVVKPEDRFSRVAAQMPVFVIDVMQDDVKCYPKFNKIPRSLESGTIDVVPESKCAIGHT